MYVTAAAIAGIVLGFIAGLCAYRTSRRWCPACGSNLSCTACASVGVRRNTAARRFR
ncbi:hypothetical protein [Plantactinospora sonchi]|uniref:FeoB-associated Cys-rich membrane protein n=1 Tax=Plantactinospora sonchi TaxID=1544735 RepID=A0ABU7RYZ2_9ACTN